MEKITVQGPSGSLQAALHMAKIESTDFLIICHPHPQFGGTMDNKVVTTVAKTYLDLGMNVIRFNYRGVGESQGEYGEVAGEVEDALAVLSWLQVNHAVSRVFLAGFSFGAYIAAKVAFVINADINNKVSVPHLLLIAPSVENSPFELATPVAAPCSVLMGKQDEVVPFASVEAWVLSQIPAVEFIVLPDATHFFHGQLVTIKQRLNSILTDYIG
ncbi:MAG: alpha/beta superfamily hydrolase [Psychrobacter glaciei]|jgi:alpha/beta superfamily hydrolase